MRKMFATLCVLGGLAFAAAAPASATPANGLASTKSSVAVNGAVDNVHYKRGWRHRHYKRHYGWRKHRRHYGYYGRPRYYGYGYRPYRHYGYRRPGIRLYF